MFFFYHANFCFVILRPNLDIPPEYLYTVINSYSRYSCLNVLHLTIKAGTSFPRDSLQLTYMGSPIGRFSISSVGQTGLSNSNICMFLTSKGNCSFTTSIVSQNSSETPFSCGGSTYAVYLGYSGGAQASRSPTYSNS